MYMKEEQLKENTFIGAENKKFFIITVPNDSKEYFINNCGCLRYSQGSMSSCIEPIEIGEYLTNEEHVIIGEGVSDGKKRVIVKKK
jgi:hypothetical protein